MSDESSTNPTTDSNATQPASENTAPMTGKQKYEEALSRPGQIQDEAEAEIWRGGYSPKAMYGEFIFCFVVSAILIALMFFFQWTSIWFVFVGIAGLLALFEILKFTYKRLSVRYRLTNQRFVHEEGILRRVTDRIEVIDINDVGFEQGFVERFFGVGTISIHSTDESHPILKMPGIENVEEVSHQIDSARRKERIRRGVQVINT